MRPPNASDNSHPFPARLGNFDIEMDAEGRPRLLGRGTYGETYLARHRFLESPAAIKVISERFLAQAKAREQFLAEARAVARLRHPHIAQVHDFGVIDNGLFYAMEFCAGGNLAEWMRAHGSMSPQQVLAVAQQSASALKCCHATGFIHRDLKPANLMLSGADGPLVVKLIDFGLVQTGPQDGGDAARHIGTPLYASPEQLKEQDVDARSDLFSLGMTLWHLATGQPPDAGTSAEIIGSRLSPGSYAGRLPPALPAPLREVIECLVEKVAARRPASAAQALDALNEAALAMGAPIFTDLVHAPEGGPARPAEAADAPPVEIETFPGNLDADFVMTQILGDSASGRTYLAAAGAVPALIHVLDSKVRANARLLDRVRRNVGRLATLAQPSLLAVRDVRSYADFTVVVLDAPVGGDLLTALKARGKVPIADARPLLETIASTCDRLTSAGLPGLELGASQVFVADGLGEVTLVPRFLTLRDRVEAGESFMPADGDAAATMTPDALTETSADDLASLFARLLYRMTAGRDSPAAASLSMQGYVAIPELSEESNRTLAQVIGRVTGYTACGPLLGRVLALEGMGAATATRTHTRAGTRTTATTATHTAFPKTATTGAQTAARVEPIVPPLTRETAPARRKMGPLIAALVIVSIAAGTGAVWWVKRPPAAGPKRDPDPAPGIVTPTAVAPPAGDRLAAGTIVRLKSGDLPGTPKFTVAGAALDATRTADGWDLAVPAGGLLLPVEIVGEVTGFSPEKLLIEGRGDLRKPLDFFPKMQKGRLTFIAENGCDYAEVGVKMTRPLADGAAISQAGRAISFPIETAGPTPAELEPGYYLLTLRSDQSNAERRWQKEVEVRAGTEQKFNLPPGWAGAYSGVLKAAGVAAPNGAGLACSLSVEPGLGGKFTEGGRWCAFEKGRLDAEGNLKLRLRWSRVEEGDPSFDWMITAKRQPDGTVLVEAAESRELDAHLESQLGRQPFTSEQWNAAGTMRAAGR